jgi:hypothetical protein
MSFLVFDDNLGEEAELLVTKLTMPASSLAHFRRQAARKLISAYASISNVIKATPWSVMSCHHVTLQHIILLTTEMEVYAK